MTDAPDAHSLIVPGDAHQLDALLTEALGIAARVADHQAAQTVAADYLSRKARNTILRQAADLDRFADYLTDAGDALGLDLGRDLRGFAAAMRDYLTTGTAPAMHAWQPVTWGLVAGFVRWMIDQGDAVGSVNVRLSTVKTYAKLATQAGTLDPAALALIRLVTGYSHKEARRIDERRDVTRRGDKKASPVPISIRQAQRLKRQPDTPQGRRDALLLCLLLDHGLRAGEVARLRVADLDLKRGELRFYRPKVDKVQTHKLTADTLRAARAWFDSGDAPLAADAPLLRASRKGGALTGAGMTAHAISGRVRELGTLIGVAGLSAHDCRHHWATVWAKRVDAFRLQEAGGWASLAMPRRYVADAQVANEGMA